jgi:hypothetical protein
MKVAIIGLANSGKTTVFNALTGQRVETAGYVSVSGDPHKAIVKVPDPRLDTLSSLFKPKKTTHASIEYIDSLGLTKGDLKQNRKVFDIIKDSDALVQVVRVFGDEAVAHPLGSLDTARDVETVELELIFGDLEVIEKRLQKIEEGIKRGKKPDESEKRTLLKCRDNLLRELPLRSVDFTPEDEQALRPFQFLSIIPEIAALNIGGQDTVSGMYEQLMSDLSTRYPGVSFRPICGKIEMEIAELSPDDRKLFLDDMGLAEPVAHRLIRECFALLEYISFFTYAGDEVRAWTIRKGTPALKAAGKVHSDIERGFIRAEVISFHDLLSVGDIHAARGKGFIRLEGKAYVVNDGDVINFRFNV